FALYANLDNFTFSEATIPLAERTESDRWISSKLNSLIALVDTAYDEYEPTRAARAIQDFAIDDLSNWYVRLNRKRFWKPAAMDSQAQSKDKTAAYQTLYTCLETLAKLAAPISPFYMDRLFSVLNAVSGRNNVVSVNLTDFTVSDEGAVDKELETKMNLAQEVSSLVHSLRKKHTIKVRQPLSRILVPVLSD